VLIDKAEFEASRALPAYRVGIWLVRLSTTTFLVTVALRVVGVLPAALVVGVALTTVTLVAGIAARVLFARAGAIHTTSQGEQRRLRPPAAMIYRDVFWLGRRGDGRVQTGPLSGEAAAVPVAEPVALPMTSAPSGAVTTVSLASWSAQPLRRDGRRVPMGLLITVGVVAVVLVTAVALVLRFQPSVRSQSSAALPDLRPLLVAAPADAVPCPQDNAMVSVAELGRANALPGNLVPVLRDSGLRGGTLRCWMPLGGSVIDVMLLRFDTPKHAAQVLAPAQVAQLHAAGAADFADIPEVPGGRTFTLPGGGLNTRQLWAVGSRAETAFIILGALSPTFDATAAARNSWDVGEVGGPGGM
jgi:hypothetical protein